METIPFINKRCFMRLGFIVFPVIVAVSSVSYCLEYEHTTDVVNQDFAFRASSDHGAVGDIVAIELSLLVENLHAGIRWFVMTVAYDDSVLELVQGPQYSETSEEFIFYYFYEEIPDDQRLPGATGKAFNIMGSFNVGGAVDDYFAAGNVLPISNIYFRLIGKAGESSPIRFSEEEFAGPIQTSRRAYYDNVVGFCKKQDEINPDTVLKVRSSQNIPGEIRIFPGEATRTEVPSSPPLAKVYHEPPTPETTNVQFELTGGTVRPGATEVPVDLYITSNYEFSSYLAAGAFPSQYLTLQRIEDHVRSGARYIDNATGKFWIVSDLSRWRLGLENERVLVATLYFDVSEDAGKVETLSLDRTSPRF